MFTEIGYNYPKNPTIKNVDKWFYNCGGYALGNFRWYLPVATSGELYYIHNNFLRNEEYEKATALAVEHMVEEYKLVVVSEKAVSYREIDYKKYEIIAFRFEMEGEDSDFHFMKIGKNGNWYEKRGSEQKIYRHPYNYVFENWAGRYDGPIAFMVRLREET